MVLKNWKRDKYVRIWEFKRPEDTYKFSMWVGTNNKIYLATGDRKEIVYEGKSEKDANLKLREALNKDPADILYYGL